MTDPLYFNMANEQRLIVPINRNQWIKVLLVYKYFRTLYTLEESKNASGGNWTTHTFPQCDSSKCGCDVRDIRRTHLLSLASTYNGIRSFINQKKGMHIVLWTNLLQNYTLY